MKNCDSSMHCYAMFFGKAKGKTFYWNEQIFVFVPYRSDGKVWHLEAQNQQCMTLWLEQLQRKRRLYNKRRTVISEKITWTHRVSILLFLDPL